MMGWQWNQLDHMQIICTLLQTDNHASTSSRQQQKKNKIKKPPKKLPTPGCTIYPKYCAFSRGVDAI